MRCARWVGRLVVLLVLVALAVVVLLLLVVVAVAVEEAGAALGDAVLRVLGSG